MCSFYESKFGYLRMNYKILSKYEVCTWPYSYEINLLTLLIFLYIAVSRHCRTLLAEFFQLFFRRSSFAIRKRQINLTKQHDTLMVLTAVWLYTDWLNFACGQIKNYFIRSKTRWAMHCIQCIESVRTKKLMLGESVRFCSIQSIFHNYVTFSNLLYTGEHSGPEAR